MPADARYFRKEDVPICSASQPQPQPQSFLTSEQANGTSPSSLRGTQPLFDKKLWLFTTIREDDDDDENDDDDDDENDDDDDDEARSFDLCPQRQERRREEDRRSKAVKPPEDFEIFVLKRNAMPSAERDNAKK
uniref:Uncharacterized protein n=1 Tax=Vespula pensylvanica TaxID=30213 RepID=A0A834NSB1_VESPE|nr:hypothetical protein H0235_011543 [Vespula pensylvanica]